jgi:hypothetical protein
VLKPPMAGLIGRIAAREVVPGRARAQDPQDPVQRGARIAPRPAAPIGATLGTKQRFEDLPLRVGKVHALDVRRTSRFVHKPDSGFMR